MNERQERARSPQQQTERDLWSGAPPGQKSFLVQVLHWYHFRTPALRGSWRTEEAMTWELIRALQVLPKPVLLRPLLDRLVQLGGEAAVAARPLLGAEVEVEPYPSLGYVDERPNCRSDVGLSARGHSRIWLEAKTRSFSAEDLSAQLAEQRAALSRIAPDEPTAVVALLPSKLADAFQPCLTWSDVLATLEAGIAGLPDLLPERELRRGYDLVARELAERIRTHPNEIAVAR